MKYILLLSVGANICTVYIFYFEVECVYLEGMSYYSSMIIYWNSPTTKGFISNMLRNQTSKIRKGNRAKGSLFPGSKGQQASETVADGPMQKRAAALSSRECTLVLVVTLLLLPSNLGPG